MKMQAIHNSRYTAEYGETARGPLLVVTKTKGGGSYIEGEDAEDWADHIRSAIDRNEADALCKAILEA